MFLKNSLLNGNASYLIDSISLIDKKCDVRENCFIVLWDGYNSYLELLDKLPHLKKQTDLVYVYVGSFKEIKQALPLGAFPLFVDNNNIQFERVNVPLFFRLFSLTRTLNKVLQEPNR
jgi:hypothetical protein